VEKRAVDIGGAWETTLIRSMRSFDRSIDRSNRTNRIESNRSDVSLESLESNASSDSLM